MRVLESKAAKPCVLTSRISQNVSKHEITCHEVNSFRQRRTAWHFNHQTNHAILRKQMYSAPAICVQKVETCWGLRRSTFIMLPCIAKFRKANHDYRYSTFLTRSWSQYCLIIIAMWNLLSRPYTRIAMANHLKTCVDIVLSTSDDAWRLFWAASDFTVSDLHFSLYPMPMLVSFRFSRLHSLTNVRESFAKPSRSIQYSIP